MNKKGKTAIFMVVATLLNLVLLLIFFILLFMILFGLLPSAIPAIMDIQAMSFENCLMK